MFHALSSFCSFIHSSILLNQNKYLWTPVSKNLNVKNYLLQYMYSSVHPNKRYHYPKICVYFSIVLSKNEITYIDLPHINVIKKSHCGLDLNFLVLSVRLWTHMCECVLLWNGCLCLLPIFKFFMVFLIVFYEFLYSGYLFYLISWFVLYLFTSF